MAGAAGTLRFRASLAARRAATPPSVTTQALRDSRITWNGPSLNRFLSAPSQMVPGTAMAVSITDPQQRSNPRRLPEMDQGSSAGPRRQTRQAHARGGGPELPQVTGRRTLPVELTRSISQRCPRRSRPPPRATVPSWCRGPAYGAIVGFRKASRLGLFAKDLEGPRKIVVTPGGELFCD